jgi:hypothetical protein
VPVEIREGGMSFNNQLRQPNSERAAWHSIITPAKISGKNYVLAKWDNWQQRGIQ